MLLKMTTATPYKGRLTKIVSHEEENLDFIL